jgi:hypothetical protein
LLFCAFLVSISRGDEPRLALSDLAAYRAALEGKPAEPAASVTFRDLWDHPESHEGHRVRVEGRVARRFRQGAIGAFPPLVEMWITSAAGDPICLVFPEKGAAVADPPLGSSVRFEGTFLRRIRYNGGDSPRLAPWIVGDHPPVVVALARSNAGGMSSKPFQGSRFWFDATLGVGAVAVVLFILFRQHLQRPPARRLDHDPPPEFTDD